MPDPTYNNNSSVLDFTPLPDPTQDKTEYSLDAVLTRRVQALRDSYPTLPLPVAVAMVECTLNQPIGVILRQLEDALEALDTLPDLTQLSGSQVRVLDVTLRQITSSVIQLQDKLHLVWENH